MRIVAFQGEHGAFSEAAAERLVDEPIALLPCASFAAVVNAVVDGGADYGVLPLENLVAGPVHAAHAALDAAARIERIREIDLPVHQALLGLPGAREEEIREVLSHPVALAQVTRWLAEHPEVKAVEASDTAGAARMVGIRHERQVGAIAAPWAAARYGLAVIRPAIQDRPDNVTRFVLVGRKAFADGPPRSLA